VFQRTTPFNVKMDKEFSEDHDTNSQTVWTLAESGDSDAQFLLGAAYASSGNESDYAEAAQWYVKAAEQNHALAQFNLGIMYSKGQGVDRDKTVSQTWMSKAAALGDAGAQYEFGMRQHRLSMDGSEGALELKIDAYKWLLLAAAQGYGSSETGCDYISQDLTQSGVIEGKRRAELFKPGNKE
jgi:TPR repeat protein